MGFRERHFQAPAEQPAGNDLEIPEARALINSIHKEYRNQKRIAQAELDEFFSFNPPDNQLESLFFLICAYGVEDSNFSALEDIFSKIRNKDDALFKRMVQKEYSRKFAFDNLEKFSLPKELQKEFRKNFIELPSIINNFFTLNSSNFEKTALSALKLHAFNFLKSRDDTSEKELGEELEKYKKMSKKESAFKKLESNFPTIGIEIELPDNFLTPDKVVVLDCLSIKNYKEHAGKNLWEVNPDFSYSPDVPARILQELAIFGAVPLKESPHSKLGEIPEEEPLSLHLNFAPRNDLEPSDFEKEDISLISGLLTYGFSSPERMVKRKRREAFMFKHNAEGDPDINTKPNFRLEFKAAQFRNYSTFRLLSESQRLVALLFTHTAFDKSDKSGEVLDEKQDKINQVFLSLKKEIENLMQEYGVKPDQMDDTDNIPNLVEVLRTTDLQKRCRSLITKYSKEAAKILDLADSVDEEKEAQESVLEM
jgi:hypothetical protein